MAAGIEKRDCGSLQRRPSRVQTLTGLSVLTTGDQDEDTQFGNHCAVSRVGRTRRRSRGFFEKEGIKIEWLDREKDVDKSAQLNITNHKDAPRFASHGRLMEEGKADLYNACEWGNYSRVEGTKVASRQVGRRSIVTYAALVVRGDLPVQTPQQFANVQIGVPMFSGTHYLTLQMLEGFVPRDQIKLGRVPNGSPYRFKMLMDGTVNATTLTEPYISLAEKGLPAGHRRFPPWHRGCFRARRCGDLCRIQSRRAHNVIPHQCQQTCLSALLPRLL